MAPGMPEGSPSAGQCSRVYSGWMENPSRVLATSFLSKGEPFRAFSTIAIQSA